MLLQPEFTYLERLSTESSVDDLGTCRGVVLRRAASILRSIETQPLTGRFVRSVGQSFIVLCCIDLLHTQHMCLCQCVCVTDGLREPTVHRAVIGVTPVSALCAVGSLFCFVSYNRFTAHSAIVFFITHTDLIGVYRAVRLVCLVS